MIFMLDIVLCPRTRLCLLSQKTIGLYSLGLKCRILNFPLLDSPIIIDYCEKGPDLVTSNLTFSPFKGTVSKGLQTVSSDFLSGH